MKHIDFWFSIGSTYTYLSVMRVPGVEKRSGIRFDWHPFSVRELMQEMNNVPFVGKPAKEKYMWRDLERRAKALGLPVSLPVEYPLKNFDLANRIAVVAKHEGWCEDYVRTTYRLWFQEGLPAGGPRNLERGLEELGHSEKRVRDLAASEPVEAAYREATAEARALGIFGAPSFVVGGKELFWGDDRLEDAIEWAERR
jgi:2-hydroxychromene-2-carboxylate isomerase